MLRNKAKHYHRVFITLTGCLCVMTFSKVYSFTPVIEAHVITNPELLTVPQWTTSSRLLKPGEAIKFNFFLPPDIKSGLLTIFPRYLEQTYPQEKFKADGGLDWLEDLQGENIPLNFTDGQAHVTYQPKIAGNFLARWNVDSEILYRYFAVIEDDYALVRYSSTPHKDGIKPTLHATGIPCDLPLKVEDFQADNVMWESCLSAHRCYGDTIVPWFPDTPELSNQQRVQLYGKSLEKITPMLPDRADLRCGRVEMWHVKPADYAKTFADLGITSHFGLQMANGGSWLGMPEFPYFASYADIRRINQSDNTAVVTHQWDFCGGWHFLGPIDWHYNISGNTWTASQKCIRQGIKEAANAAQLSGHPFFLSPLYEANAGDNEALFKFVEQYQRFVAFQLTKEFKLVFTRAIDLADYYQRHYTVTPRTIFVSQTDHVFYDMHWHNLWAGSHLLAARQRLPWLTRISTILKLRKTHCGAKDPMSYEYIVLEDQKRSLRFERQSPNPIWWFEYTDKGVDHTPENCPLWFFWRQTPDVDVVHPSADRADGVGNPPRLPQWEKTAENSLTLKMKMLTKADFEDYAIAVWGLPQEFTKNPDPARIKTNAKEFAIARNTDGEYHLILVFDLKPDLILEVTLNQ